MGFKAFKICGLFIISNNPNNAIVTNQTSIIGPKTAPTFPVPNLSTANKIEISPKEI